MLYMEDIEDNMEERSDDNQITKPKKPRSEKQIEAFEKAMAKRKENVEKRKEETLIQASEILVKANKKVIPQENKKTATIEKKKQ